MDNAEVNDIAPGNSVDIVIRLPGGMTTTVTAFVDTDKKQHLENCKWIARKLSITKSNTYRPTNNDKGNMYVVGNGNKGKVQQECTN